MTMTPTEPMPLDEQLCFSLYGASIAMNRAYKPMLDKLGITYPQYLVLQVLWEQDGRTIGGIAERLALESSTITPLVKRLATAGFVARTRDAGDERHVRVTLTPSGAALSDEGACLAKAILIRTGMTLGQLQTLTGEIRKLRQALATAPVTGGP